VGFLMKTRFRLCWFVAAAAALGAALPTASVRAEADVVLAVIVAPGSKLGDLGVSDLRRTFTGERTTDPSGNKLIPLNHPPKTVDRVGFDQKVLGMAPDEVGRFWVDRRIRGGSGPPRTVESIATLRRVVQNLPGAIGYLRRGQLSGEVKPVRIDGKLPGEPGYPVHFRE
jgi:hypothetical protein